MAETTDPRTVPVPPAGLLAESPRLRVPSPELDQLRAHAATLQSFRQAVINLTAGRPDMDLMTVAELRAAVAAPPTAGAPLPLTWPGNDIGPVSGGPGAQTLLPLVTRHNTPAELVLNNDERALLAGLLGARLHPAVPCTTPDCGATEDEIDHYADEKTERPGLDVWGWIHVHVHGTDGPPRWWCSQSCATAAITAGGTELAAADRTAATDPAQDDESLIDPCRPCGCPKAVKGHTSGYGCTVLAARTADDAFAAALPQMMTTAVSALADARGLTPEQVRERMDAVFGDPCRPCGCPKRFDRHAEWCTDDDADGTAGGVR